MKYHRTNGAVTFAMLLTKGGMDESARPELARHIRWLCVPFAAVTLLVAAWAGHAPLTGAVVAPGTLKVELNRKTVQHQEGGIVREILVRDGQKVRAGDPLLAIGDVRSDAELSLLQDQLRAERFRTARASAEALLKEDFIVPLDLASDPHAAAHLGRERDLFEARRRTLDQQIASLQTQVKEAGLQVAALGAQIASTQVSAKLATEELTINETLAKEGFIQRARVLQLQRVEADYRSRIDEARSELAAARQRIGELQARMGQARNQYQQIATDELKEAAAREREIEERLRPSRDQVERQLVRSPVDGVVMALRVTAVGEAVGPREPLLDVVPTHEKLVIEARIRPQDIDSVNEAASAQVRLAAFDARKIPLLPAKVLFVSPDRISDPETSESWFVASVEVDAAALEGYPQLRLRAGMPAELFITTSERTLLEYLAEPLGVFANRAMREP
jgi:HlyD family type I secretion membrane fusion protein